MIREVVKHALRESHQSRNAAFHPPASSLKAERRSIEATLDIQARTRRNEPAAADRQLLPSHPQDEFPVATGLFFPFEERLMEVQRVLIRGPRRVQFPIDKTALDFSENAKPGAQVKICAQEISLKEVAVPCGGNVSDAANSKSLGPESDLPAQREESILRAE